MSMKIMNGSKYSILAKMANLTPAQAEADFLRVLEKQYSDSKYPVSNAADYVRRMRADMLENHPVLYAALKRAYATFETNHTNYKGA